MSYFLQEAWHKSCFIFYKKMKEVESKAKIAALYFLIFVLIYPFQMKSLGSRNPELTCVQVVPII